MLNITKQAETYQPDRKDRVLKVQFSSAGQTTQPRPSDSFTLSLGLRRVSKDGRNRSGMVHWSGGGSQPFEAAGRSSLERELPCCHGWKSSTSSPWDVSETYVAAQACRLLKRKQKGKRKACFRDIGYRKEILEFQCSAKSTVLRTRLPPARRDLFTPLGLRRGRGSAIRLFTISTGKSSWIGPYQYLQAPSYTPE